MKPLKMQKVVKILLRIYTPILKPIIKHLHVRLEDDESSCITSTELQLIVNPIPDCLVGPAYEVCDDDYDGITDLTILVH